MPPESPLETHKTVVKNFLNQGAKAEVVEYHEIVVGVKIVVKEWIVGVEKKEKKPKGEQVGNPRSSLKEVVKKEKHEEVGEWF